MTNGPSPDKFMLNKFPLLFCVSFVSLLYYLGEIYPITSHHINFISPRIYKSSYIANFSEKDRISKKNKIVYYIQYLKLLFT